MIEQSGYGMKNIPYLSVVAEVDNSGVDLTADASKTNEEYYNMNISDKEEKKFVGYHENFKIDVKNIDKTIKTIWRPMYEVINVTFLKEINIFTQYFLDLSKKSKSTSVATI